MERQEAVGERVTRKGTDQRQRAFSSFRDPDRAMGSLASPGDIIYASNRSTPTDFISRYLQLANPYFHENNVR